MHLRRPHFMLSTLCIYVVPLGIIIIFYSKLLMHPHIVGSKMSSIRSNIQQRKRRITLLATIAILLFAVCWLPRHVFILILAFSRDLNYEQIKTLIDAVSWFTLLVCLNSAINPFLYALAGTGFAKHIPFTRSFCNLPSVRKKEPDPMLSDISSANEISGNKFHS